VSFVGTFLAETAQLIESLDEDAIEHLATRLRRVRDRGGRLFILGVGGSAGHARHAVNDFRKLCGFEAYAHLDNVSELTARPNDEGWETTFSSWLEGSRLRSDDGLLVFSVGGGDAERGVSQTWCSRSTTPAPWVPRCSGSWAATAATPPGPRTRASSWRRCFPSGSPLTPRVSVRHLAPARQSSGAAERAGQMGVGSPGRGIGVIAGRGRVIIVGGAGSIGSHFTDELLADDRTRQVTLYDSFSSGQEWHYAHHAADPRLVVVRCEANDQEALCAAMDGHDLVIHLASNPDIAAAMTNPAIDFDEGTKITHNVVEAMRRAGVPRIAYASGSGVYGDLGELEATEDHGPLMPVSTYGASKLAGEALMSSYAHLFELVGRVFRFGNVVGRRQTHGVGFDFVRRLSADPTQVTVLGDGSQSKSYVLVTDVVAAVLTAVDADLQTPSGRSTLPQATTSPFGRSWAGARDAGDRPSGHRRRVRDGAPRLEGRRARRVPEHRSHPGARMAPEHRVGGRATGIDAGDARRPDCGSR
jgi:UDP-glucose 4-epimerase